MAIAEVALSLGSSGIAADDRLAGAAMPAAPSPENVARFNAAMGDDAGWLDGAVPGSPFSGTAPGPAGPSPLNGLGDRLVNGLDQASNEYLDLKNSIGGKPGGAEPSLVEMLRMQATVIQATVTFELAGKVISRSTQNVDQLTRIQ